MAKNQFNSCIQTFCHPTGRSIPENPEPIIFGEYNDLIFELDKWREERNQAIHEIVQSHTHPERSIESFLLHSKSVAERGEKLTSAISQWCDKKIRAAK